MALKGPTIWPRVHYVIAGDLIPVTDSSRFEHGRIMHPARAQSRRNVNFYKVSFLSTWSPYLKLSQPFFIWNVYKQIWIAPSQVKVRSLSYHHPHYWDWHMCIWTNVVSKPNRVRESGKWARAELIRFLVILSLMQSKLLLFSQLSLCFEKKKKKQHQWFSQTFKTMNSM